MHHVLHYYDLELHGVCDGLCFMAVTCYRLYFILQNWANLILKGKSKQFRSKGCTVHVATFQLVAKVDNT